MYCSVDQCSQHRYMFQQLLSSSGTKNIIQHLVHVIDHHAGMIMTETAETCHCDNVKEILVLLNK